MVDTNANRQKRIMILPLTSLRFVFALMVFCHHISFINQDDTPGLQWIYLNIFAEGFIGVNFFFMLSGFILSYNYQDRFLSKNISYGNFWIARIARIYPLHLLTLLLAIPLFIHKMILGNKLFWSIKLMAHTFLFHSFIPVKSVYLSFNRPSWSISDEMFFYLLFPVLIGFICKGITQKNWQLMVIILLLSIVPISMMVAPESVHHALYYVNPITRLADFVLGIVVYNLFLLSRAKFVGFNWSWLEIFALILLSLFFLFHQKIPLVFRFSIYYWIPMGVLIFVMAFQSGIVSRWLSARWLVILGEISFGFYLFHHLVIKYFEILNNTFLHLTNNYVIVVVIFVITLGLSLLSFYFFEKPMNSFVKARFNLKSNR